MGVVAEAEEAEEEDARDDGVLPLLGDGPDEVCGFAGVRVEECRMRSECGVLRAGRRRSVDMVNECGSL